MAVSISCGYPCWVDGGTYPAVQARTMHIAATFLNTGPGQVTGGVLPSGGQMALTAPSSGMSVNVATGYALCPSSAGSTAGGYLFGLLTPGSLQVATSDNTNPRVDLVAAYVTDDGTADSYAYVAIYTGTPTAGATISNLAGAPAIPPNGVACGYVLVPAKATSITTGDLATTRPVPETVTQGGILPVPASSAPPGYNGMLIWDPLSGSFMHNPPSGPARARVLPWPPVISVNAADVSAAISEATLCTVTVTTDGATDIEITATYVGMSYTGGSGAGPNGLANCYANMNVYVDSAVVRQCATPNLTAANLAQGGGSIVHVTSGAGGDTPSAGTHVISFGFYPHYDGTHNMTVRGSQSPSVLYVRAVPL